MPDRTTLRAAITALSEEIQAGIISDPPTAGKPFRRLIQGEVKGDEFARPFLAIRLERAKPLASSEGDRLFESSVGLSIAADVAGDAHDGILALVAAVEDLFDALQGSGLIEGADGFDDRAWSFRYAPTTSGARRVLAEATMGLVVRVARELN